MAATCSTRCCCGVAHFVATLLLVGAFVTVVLYGQMGWLPMIVLLLLIGPNHPPTADDQIPLGTGRTILGWLTLAFVLIGFTPFAVLPGVIAALIRRLSRGVALRPLAFRRRWPARLADGQDFAVFADVLEPHARPASRRPTPASSRRRACWRRSSSSSSA